MFNLIALLVPKLSSFLCLTGFPWGSFYLYWYGLFSTHSICKQMHLRFAVTPGLLWMFYLVYSWHIPQNVLYLPKKNHQLGNRLILWLHHTCASKIQNCQICPLLHLTLLKLQKLLSHKNVMYLRLQRGW